MKFFLKQIALYGFFIFILLNLVALGSFWSLRKSTFYKPSFAVNQDIANLDYIVLGSSTGLTTLNTVQIDSLTNWKGLNLSMDDTGLPSHYLMLKHFLVSGGHINKCVLAITPWDLANSNPSLGNNDHRFLPFIFNKEVKNHFRDLPTSGASPLFFSAFIPLYGLGYYNTELFYPSLIAFAKPEYRNRFDEKGNYVYPNLGKSLSVNAIKQSEYSFNNPYLEKIKLLCKEHKVKLILYQSPMLNQHQVSLKSMDLINHSALLEQDTNLFYDEIHVNKKGRKIATKSFVDAIFKR